jgi:hypothetical protein
MWQPIKTAPLDGTHILAVSPTEQHVVTYDGDAGEWVAAGCVAVHELTHWMPLPELPEFDSVNWYHLASK